MFLKHKSDPAVTPITQGAGLSDLQSLPSPKEQVCAPEHSEQRPSECCPTPLAIPQSTAPCSHSKPPPSPRLPQALGTCCLPCPECPSLLALKEQFNCHLLSEAFPDPPTPTWVAFCHELTDQCCPTCVPAPLDGESSSGVHIWLPIVQQHNTWLTESAGEMPMTS